MAVVVLWLVAIVFFIIGCLTVVLGHIDYVSETAIGIGLLLILLSLLLVIGL